MIRLVTLGHPALEFYKDHYALTHKCIRKKDNPNSENQTDT